MAPTINADLRHSLAAGPNDSPNLAALLADWLPAEPQTAEAPPIRIDAGDGYPLAARLYEPAGETIAAVQINGATGVPQRYYAAYARYLARQGFAVLTYDYRGIGQSRSREWQGEAPRMLHWGERDLAATLDWLHARYPGLPLLAVGHSGGGWLSGLAANNHLLRAQFTVASQNGYWRHWPARLQPVLAGLWHLAMPAATRTFGKLPAALMGAELPAGVARDWARWCRHPQFITDERGRPLRAHFQSWQGRLRLTALADDDFYAPQRAVRALAPLYASAQTEVVVCEPRRYGVRAIGHFGYFRAHMPQALWQEGADWLRAAARD